MSVRCIYAHIRVVTFYIYSERNVRYYEKKLNHAYFILHKYFLDLKRKKKNYNHVQIIENSEK